MQGISATEGRNISILHLSREADHIPKINDSPLVVRIPSPFDNLGYRLIPDFNIGQRPLRERPSEGTTGFRLGRCFIGYLTTSLAFFKHFAHKCFISLRLNIPVAHGRRRRTICKSHGFISDWSWRSRVSVPLQLIQGRPTRLVIRAADRMGPPRCRHIVIVVQADSMWQIGRARGRRVWREHRRRRRGRRGGRVRVEGVHC
jgi:hypothetical protein